MDPRLEIGIYRIVQELVSNVLKHAKARHLTIQVTRLEHPLNLTVEDDGVGFESHKTSAGMGLTGGRSRDEELQDPGTGTAVMVDIPLPTQR